MTLNYGFDGIGIEWGEPLPRTIQYHTATPKEPFMADAFFSQPLRPNDFLIPTSFRDFLVEADQKYAEAKKTPEQKFQDLDVQPGDRIRLRQARAVGAFGLNIKTDGATLEGVVRAVKQKYGRSRVQIEGFHVNGNGIFWPVSDYVVEVLHRAYRMTPEDKAIATILGESESSWKAKSESTRQHYRDTYGPRLTKVKRVLGIDGGVE